MSPLAQTDWFTENAPKAGSANTDWFALNAPKKQAAPPPEKEGFLSALGSTLLKTAKGIVMPQGVSPYGGMDLEQKQEIAAGAHAEDVQRKEEGRSGPYRAVAGLGSALGIDVAGQEEAARRGDPAGVLGHAVGSGVVAASPLLIEGAAKGANKIIPSTTRAGKGLNVLAEVYGEHPIEPANAASTIARFERELEPTPSIKLPPLIRDFQARVMESSPALGTASRPLTFAEARAFLKRANEAAGSASKGIEQNALRSFAQSLSDDIHAGVAQPSPIAPQGFAADYNKFTTEYRRGSKIIRAGEEAGPIIGAGLGYEAGRKAGQPVGGMLIGGMAGKYVGRKTVGAATRAIIEREAAPTLSIPHTPEEYTRTILAAKEGSISAGEADRRIARGGGSVRVLRRPEEPTQ